MLTDGGRKGVKGSGGEGGERVGGCGGGKELGGGGDALITRAFIGP